MQIRQQQLSAFGIKFFAEENGQEIARAYLYILNNDLHQEPFGFLEDIFVDEAFQKQGIGTKLIKNILAVAKEKGCYKVVGTSRHERKGVHQFYLKLGFKDYGKEFRLDF